MENQKESQMKNEVESGVCAMVSATFHKQGVPKIGGNIRKPKRGNPVVWKQVGHRFYTLTNIPRESSAPNAIVPPK